MPMYDPPHPGEILIDNIRGVRLDGDRVRQATWCKHETRYRGY